MRAVSHQASITVLRDVSLGLVRPVLASPPLLSPCGGPASANSSRCLSSSAAAPRSKTPTLNSTLRRFYFLVHPDLFHSHPLHRSVNEANLQHFLGFVTAMKQTSSAEPWPPARHTNLTFYVRRRARDGLNTQLSFIDYCEQREQGKKGRRPPPAVRKAAEAGRGGRGGEGGRPEDSEFHVLRVTLSTNGGSCKAMVERQLRHLFCMAALPEEFVWDDEYWQQKAPISRAEADGDEAAAGLGIRRRQRRRRRARAARERPSIDTPLYLYQPPW